MDARGAAAFAAGAAAGAAVAWWALAGGAKRLRLDWNALAPVADGAVARGGAVAAAVGAAPPPSVARFAEDEVLSEQLARNVQFFGAEAQQRVAGAFVVVVGLGGVGSHAAHMLLRSGVGRLRLVDFDRVTLSTLNRHAVATRADVGAPKAAATAARFAAILPEASVQALDVMYCDATEEQCLEGSPDFVIDAIDNIDTKVALLAACRRRGLAALAVAGAGAKADPTRLRFADVSESAVDPLARAVRLRLRRDHGVAEGVTVLLSSERPRCGLVFGGAADAPPAEYQTVPGFRVRTVPVLGTTPAAFGMAAAAHALCALAGTPLAAAPHFRVPERAFATQRDRLEARELARWEAAGGGGGGGGGDSGGEGAGGERASFALGVDAAEVEVLVRELWRGASARAGARPPTEAALARGLGELALTRWDPARPGAVDNLVLLTRAEADAHDAEASAAGGLDALRAREPALAARVEAVLARARREFLHAYF